MIASSLVRLEASAEILERPIYRLPPNSKPSAIRQFNPDDPTLQDEAAERLMLLQQERESG